MRFLAEEVKPGGSVRVIINRTTGLEVLELTPSKNNPLEYVSTVAPEEPHEFSAEVEIRVGDQHVVALFEMHEPDSHHHDHRLMSDDEHARAHAATIPHQHIDA